MNLKEKIRVIPDFPKPGISFKDITTLLKDGDAFRYTIFELASKCGNFNADLIVGPEARGFLIGAPLAYEMGLGFIPVRKKGKLPGETLQGTYELEYDQDILEIHRDAVKPGQKILLADDLLATGGTISATIKLIEQLGGEILSLVFLIELTELKGRENLKDYPVISLIQYPF